MKDQQEYVLRKSSSIFDFTIYILRNIAYRQLSDGEGLSLAIKRRWKYIDPNQFKNVKEFILGLKLLQQRLGEIQHLAEKLEEQQEIKKDGLFIICGIEAGKAGYITAYAVTDGFPEQQMERAASIMQKLYPNKNWRLYMLDSRQMQYSMNEYRHSLSSYPKY